MILILMPYLISRFILFNDFLLVGVFRGEDDAVLGNPNTFLVLFSSLLLSPEFIIKARRKGVEFKKIVSFHTLVITKMISVAIEKHRKFLPIFRQKYSVFSSSQYSAVMCPRIEMSVKQIIAIEMICSSIFIFLC